MSLRSKILLVLVPVVLGYALLDHLVQRSILQPSFERLEQLQSREDISRVVREIDGQATVLQRETEGRAALGRFPGYLAGNDPSFLEDYFSPVEFLPGRFDLAWVVDEHREVRFWHLGDQETGGQPRLKDFVRGLWAEGHPLLAAINGLKATYDPLAPVTGFLATEVGPLVVASAPIVDPRDPTHSLGRVILGRFLGPEALATISKRLGLVVDFWTLDQASERIDGDLFDELTSTAVPVHRTEGPERLESYATIHDLRAQAALIVRASSPRPITENGLRVMRYALLSTVAAGLLLLLVLLRTMQRTVLQPIASLTSHAESIGRTDNTTLRIASDRQDELGTLAREFDGMLEKLEASRKAVVDTARAAGMSEIATGILHNVGNVLNSVGVSGTLLNNLLRGGQAAKLVPVVRLLEQHQEDLPKFMAEDPRGRKLLPLLKALSNGIEQERDSALVELASLNSGLGHIKELVASQQAYATRVSLREIIHLPELVEEALAITGRAAGEFRQIQVDRKFCYLKPFPVDRHKVLEVLVNVIQNARQSMDDAGQLQPRIEVRIEQHGTDRVAIAVRDNGGGIPSENLDKIFNHGFTTKRQGHGFGLHSAANAAAALEGKLSATSGGPGQGAEFILEIPYAVRHAA